MKGFSYVTVQNRPYVIPMIYVSFAAMFMSVELVEILADKFDFVLGIEREH